MSKFSEFIKAVTQIHEGAFCIVTHRNADLDALASSIALREILLRLNPSMHVYLIFPEGIDRTSKTFIEEFNIKIPSSDAVGNACVNYIVVDSSSKEQLGNYSHISGYILIDHHEVNTLIDNAVLDLYEPRRKATSEIIANLIFFAGINVSAEAASLLIGGILYDSRFLQLADDVTFEVLAKLIRLGGNYERVRSLLTRKYMDYSERIARLKGMSRLGIYRAGDYVVVITCVGAFEGALLKAITDNGADVGIVLARRDEGYRATIRVRDDVASKLSRPVAGDLALYLASNLGGSGGGHSLAGGALIKAQKLQDVLNAIRKYFLQLTGSFKEIESGRWLEECS